jgi:hypothetical protein
MAGSSLINHISRDAVDFLREFSSDFDAAFSLGEIVVWSKALGSAVLVNSSRAIKTTYPIPVSALAYEERKGDAKFRKLYEKSLSVTPREWQAGVHELARIIEAPDFIGWGDAPANIAKEALRLPNTLMAEMLEANPVLDFYAGTSHSALTLFDATHPHNIYDASYETFDNDLGSLGSTGGVSETLAAMREHFRNIKGPNGKPMGRRLTDVLVPATLEEQYFEFLQSDLMYGAHLAQGDNTQITTRNIYKGSVNLVVSDELTDDDNVYGIDRNGPAFAVLQDGGGVEEVRFDKDSDMYKRTGMIAVSFQIVAAANAALPHSICRAVQAFPG